MESSTNTAVYAARLDIDYPEKLDRLTTFFRVIWIIPIVIVLSLLTATGSGEIVGGLFFIATMLMIVFRERYPRWWFDFSRQLVRFEARVLAYLVLLTDQYPSTVDERGGGRPMGASSTGLRFLAGHGPVPAVQPQMS